jgi:hypothetical protein
MKRNWTEIIPELGDWKPGPISPESLAASEGRYPVAIGYLTLFWPSFIEYDGMIFRGEDENKDEESKKNIENWIVSYKGDKSAVETILNHLHILHIQNPGVWNTATEPQIRIIGEMLKEMWACKLARDFPDKKFIVELFEGSAENLWDYQVTFHQVR